MRLAVLVAVSGALALSGCGAILDPLAEPLIDAVFLDYPYLEESLEEAWPRAATLEYYPDGEGSLLGYWQSPRETDERGGGDCEDIAAWMVYHLGKGASLAMIHRLKDPEGPNHAVVVYGGQLLEAQRVGKVYFPGEYSSWIATISYEDVLALSTAFSTK